MPFLELFFVFESFIVQILPNWFDIISICIVDFFRRIVFVRGGSFEFFLLVFLRRLDYLMIGLKVLLLIKIHFFYILFPPPFFFIYYNPTQIIYQSFILLYSFSYILFVTLFEKFFNNFVLSFIIIYKNLSFNTLSKILFLIIIQHSMQKKSQPEVIFADIKDEQEPTKIESLCVNCEQNGTTTLLLTKIPFFREVILASFLCDHCGYRNNEVQFAGKLPDYGVAISFRILSKQDLNREIIKSEHSRIYFEELDLQIPVNGKAEITTIEGLLMRTHDELKFHQPLRRIHEPENYEKLQKFLQKIQQYLDGKKFPLTLKITDPSGNSNIKNPFAPKVDKNLEITHTKRTLQQLIAMGYSKQNAELEVEQVETKRLGTKINFSKPFEENNFMEQEPVIFEVPCHSCGLPGEEKMCQTSVPYFKDLIIMSFKCDYCGAHSTETKTSGQINENACVITLKAQGNDDLKRDLFKSETCAVNLPQIQFELDYGTLGGVFTTVEGLLEKIYDHLDSNNPFIDSDPEFAAKIANILDELNRMREGQRPFTLILTDPISHSFISNPWHPEKDPRVTIEFRPRTEEQQDHLGIKDMKVENYQQKPEEESTNETKTE